MLKTKVITGKVRLNYTNLFKPKAIEEGNKQKSISTRCCNGKWKANMERPRGRGFNMCKRWR